MNTITKLEKLIEKLLIPINKPRSDNKLAGIDTCLILFKIASSTNWSKKEIERVNFLSKRFDISKKFFLAYYSNGRKSVNAKLLDPTWLELAVALFLKALLLSLNSSDRALQLKRYNVLFKILDTIQPEWIAVDTYFEKSLMASWANFIEVLQENTEVMPSPQYALSNSNTPVTRGNSIPLTVLFYEGPIARAYLETISSLGLKPQKIIELVAAKDIATNKLVGRFLPKFMRSDYASSIQKNKIHYWSRNLIKTHPEFIDAISTEIQEKFEFTKQSIDNANSLRPLSDYSDNVESLLVDGLNDAVLFENLSQQPASALLFTGGGLVPSKLLSLQHLRFLHIHPGFLPDIRGADCTLWSTLITGHTSATCFYMSPGIDTGDVIYPCWLPPLSLTSRLDGIERQSIYRAVYGFIDPWVRSFVLRGIVGKNSQFLELSSYNQDKSEGNTFHFMSHRLQQAAFGSIFKASNSKLSSER